MFRFSAALCTLTVLAELTHAQEVGEVFRLSHSNAGVAGNSDSKFSSISHDGRIVAFESLATNLIPAGPPSFSNVFYVDNTTGLLAFANVDSNGVHGGSAPATDAAVSGNGNCIAFRSDGFDLVAGV